MARIKKRGTSGQAKNYITRTQAIRKLQVSLPDFRRLCIFKGIYPREPRNKKKASKSSTPSTTFYYAKDIQYLLHEPLLRKFRDHKALSKKISRSLGKGEHGDAVRLEKSGVGQITLDHVIKERYPTFSDALRDLDDALSMVFLFANLPPTSTVPLKTISLCQRVSQEFQHYIIVSHSLRKSFLSVKGIYYQATVQGEDIMWLVPHKFVQRVTGDVDFRIMGTFIEFYTTLLGFVNFRLYTTIGLVYPPKFDSRIDEQGGELDAFQLEGRGFGIVPGALLQVDDGEPPKLLEPSAELQRKVDAITSGAVDEMNVEPANEDADAGEVAAAQQIDSFEPAAEGADILPQPQLSNFEAASLFEPFTFFLSREAPRQPIEFLLRAFGCKRIGWDAVLGEGAFTTNEAHPSITHQIVDRPALPAMQGEVLSSTSNESGQGSESKIPNGHRVPGRTYVQPQWVWDCINNGKLLRPDQYAPGSTLPPHLSPWVKPKKGAYDPSVPLELQEREGEVDIFEEEEAEAAAAAEGEASGGENSSSEIDGDHARSDENFAGFEENGSGSPLATHEIEPENDLHQAELEAEAAGLPFSTDATASSQGAEPPRGANGIVSHEARRKAAQRKLEEKDDLQRRLGMMSRKKRTQMEKVLQAQSKEEAEAEKLRNKRRRLERQNAAA